MLPTGSIFPPVREAPMRIEITLKAIYNLKFLEIFEINQ